MLRTEPAMDEPPGVALGRAAHLNVVLVANRRLEEVDEICERYGVTQAQYVALWTLCLSENAETGVPVSAVADGLLNRASDATRLIDRMETAGLAERLPNPADRRSILVRATPTGQRVFAEVTPHLQELHRNQWSDLTARELGQLNELLKRALWGSDGADHKMQAR